MSRNGSPVSPSSSSTEVWLRSLVRGERGEALRAQLASRHPGQSIDEIEDAVQTACGYFLDEVGEIQESARAYAWIRTVAHRSLNREREHRRRELVVDPFTPGFEAIVAHDADPAERVIARENEIELARLVSEVVERLSERKRQVLALHGAGYGRQEIAARLGRSRRSVKRDLLEIMEDARAVVAQLAGGGCEPGEPLVVRFACGLASPAESSQARLHLSRCHRCEEFLQRLNLWRDKAGAALPAPAADETGPRVVERVLHKASEGVSAVKQQLVDGGAQVKQHATSVYFRAADPTPLAGARPGAVAAVVAGCVTIGGGATYCMQQGIAPLPALLEHPRAEERRAPSPPREKRQAAKTSQEPRMVQQPPPADPVQMSPTASPTPTPTPVAEPVRTPPPPPPPPPPEQAFEPSSPSYSSSPPGSSAADEPSPAAGGGVPEFGGP